ncbi:unnamed protein product [Caenorhabditis brenneri]
MIRDLSTIFGISNWKFTRIIWYFDAGVDEDKLTAPDILQKRIHLIERMLEASFLQVESISIFSTEHTAVMAILPNVIPGSLEFLGLNSDNNGAKLEDVVKLWQWKKLKRTCVQTVADSFSEDRLVKIRDILFKSTKLWRCCLTSKIEDQVNVDGNGEGISTLRELIVAVNRVMEEHPEYNADTRRYSIPDSDEHFFVYPCENYHSLQLKIKRERKMAKRISKTLSKNSCRPFQIKLRSSKMSDTGETENNICMLYEAANKTPVYEAHQKLCKFRGNRNIDFVDFEQKYYRCSHGNSDLESAESSSSKTFSDLPIDILKLVIDDLELIDKLSLRKVSKSLRSIVDGHKFVSSSVLIQFEANISVMELESDEIQYYDKNGKSSYEITRDLDKHTSQNTVKPRIIEEEHWETMIRDLSTIFGIPNWKFTWMWWCFDAGVEKDKLTPPATRQKIQSIANMLKTTPLRVREMWISSKEPTTVMAILPNLIPGILEDLDLKNDGAKLEEIVELEQWKGLKSASVDTLPDSFSIEHFFHLESFSIDQIRISEDRLVKIRDILFKSSKFRKCKLSFKVEDQVNVDENGEAIGTLREFIIVVNRIMGEHPEYNADTSCYSIPDSDEHFFVYQCERYQLVDLKIRRVKNGEEDNDDDSFEEI